MVSSGLATTMAGCGLHSLGTGTDHLGSGSMWSLVDWKTIHSDNMAVIAILQQRSAKTPEVMNMLRCISLYSSYCGFEFTSKHVPGVLNDVPDVLSWNKTHGVAFVISQIPKFQFQIHC